MLKNLTPGEAAEKLKKENDIRLIDIREDWEYRINKLEDSELMPLSRFTREIERLNKNDKIILYCHHGIRSYQAGIFLVENGFKNVSHIIGGIDAWSRDVDESIPTY